LRPASRPQVRTSTAMTYILITLALTVQTVMPVQSLEFCKNCATAKVEITDFTQRTLTWSLSFSMQGDWRNKTIFADTRNLHLFGDNLFYDQTTNTTKFSDQEIDNWNRTSPVGIFPNETWFVSLYFATNNTVDIQNFFNARPQILQVASPNYSGNYSATTLECTPLSLAGEPPTCYRQYGTGGEVKDPFAHYWPRDYYLQPAGR
jgi:hypothetical protein